MPLSRLLTLVIGLVVILAMSIWLVTSLGWLYSQVTWSANPFLANLLLLLLIGLVGLIIGAFIYYLRLLWNPQPSRRRRARPVKIPETKSEAASEYLSAVRQQVQSIQDEVSRKALLSRSKEIEATMSRGDLQIVVFGTGSAGKTSAINALLGRMVGQVSAPMGTTEEGEIYPLRLKGLDRTILITDTPGILEAGTEGIQRGQIARQWATEADLLLFVVDNDLRQSEFEPLQVLAEIGKRSIVAFNKTDLYTESDRETILARLRSKLRRFVPPSDIVPISANPPVVRLQTGEVFQPNPDIMPLIRRIVAVLRAEGEDLVADNILLQSQRLGDEARRLIDAQRRRQAVKVVDRYQWIGAGAIAVTPLPGVDLLATAAVNAQMVVEIGKIYGCELNLERGRELALSLGKTLASLGVVKGVMQLVATALQFHVGTIVVGKAIQGISAAYLTRIAGKSFIEYFRHDRDWGDGGMSEVIQRQFQLTRKEEFVKAFVKDAIARVVEPLKLFDENDAEDVSIEDEAGSIVVPEAAPRSRSGADAPSIPRRYDPVEYEFEEDVNDWEVSSAPPRDDW
ncbi:MAG: GTP-binding protein [Cyanobacteria bacterium SID2]|nr:GTP-binding protein [Cyanobacteria bacterium SID2]MBP0003659.1 GTP-binding protein [Cyanobacteria bacterium SBC]